MELSPSGPRIKLLLHQDDELTDRTHTLIYVAGGRGSGKSETDPVQIFVRAKRCKDQVYGLFANTESQLETFKAKLKELWDGVGLRYVEGTQTPKKWRSRWRRRGVIVPTNRKSNMKMLVCEDGTHVFAASMVNGAHTRVKSLDLAMALIEEATEPGVSRNAILTILGAVRCGVAKEDPDGGSECKRRGHCHQTIVKFNVPLNDPSHWMWKDARERVDQEEERRARGERPYFRLIQSRTQDNPHTGREYDERLRGAFDPETYAEQTSGDILKRVTHVLSYYSFAETTRTQIGNVLSDDDADRIGIKRLRYDPVRALHMWFDFNNRPGNAGWGHFLRPDEGEVPEAMLRPGFDYFGVVGELFSGHDPFGTERVAAALIEDPSRDDRCADCQCPMSKHREMRDFVCMLCGWRTPKGDRHCSGAKVRYDAPARKYLHLEPGTKWRGLINHRGPIYLYGDATGKSSHSDGAVDDGGNIAILRAAIRANHFPDNQVHFRFKTSNPPIRLRVLAMNRMLLQANGVRSIYHGSWCTAHLADFREIVPDENGEPKKETRSPAAVKAGRDYYLRTHCTDGEGYFVDWNWPYVRPRAGQLPLVGAIETPHVLASGWRAP